MKCFIVAALFVASCAAVTPYLGYSAYPGYFPTPLAYSAAAYNLPLTPTLYSAALEHAEPLVLGIDGKPQDTLAVQHAKMQHFTAHALEHTRSRRSVPMDTPEVMAAKQQHFAAHARALAGKAPVVAPLATPYATVAPYSIASPFTVATPYSAVATPYTVASPYSTLASAYTVGSLATPYSAAWNYVAPRSLAYPWAANWQAPYNMPVIAKGVPLETPEVIKAKAEHAYAHIEAKARHGLW